MIIKSQEYILSRINYVSFWRKIIMKYFDFLKSLITFILVSIFFCIIFLSHTVAFSQNPEWINLTSGSDILALVDDGNYLWVGGG